MRKTTVWVIIGVSLIVIGCVTLTLAMNMLKWDFAWLDTTKYETNIYDLNEEFSSISINTDTAGILFLPSKNEKCTVKCFEKQKTKHSVAVQETMLNINVDDARKWYDHISFFSRSTPKITLYLPQDKYEKLLINTDTGDIEIPSDFQFDAVDIKASTADVCCKANAINELKISLSTGDIKLESITVGGLNLTTSTGDINMKALDCKGQIKLGVSTGKAKLIDVNCNELISSGDTGDMVLTNVVANKKFDITRTTGDIKFDGCDANELYITTDTGDVIGSLLSDKVFICSSDTGSVRVPKTATGGKCEITTDTGDINIKLQK